MKCCVNCFKDSDIRKIIELYGENGDCDFCSSKNTVVYDISDPTNLISEKVTNLIQIYSPTDNENAKLLKEAFRDDWDIFSGGSEVIQALVMALCSSELGADNKVFHDKVYIEKLCDPKYVADYGVVGGLSWNEFSDLIKHTNRFFSSKFNTDVFASFLELSLKSYEERTCFYRARISSDNKGFKADEMSAPPVNKRIAGRVNPEGIGVLYLSSDEKTVLNEARASAYDYVTIGKFENIKPLKVVNLSGISKISPFLYEDYFECFALNRNVFKEMAYEIARPLRRRDSSLEYLPTQYISEFVKSKGYDGVEFESTLREGGINLALFDASLAECVDVKTIEVVNVSYETT